MAKIRILPLLSIVIACCSNPLQAAQRTWITPDFFVEQRHAQSDRHFTNSSPAPLDCRAQIRQALCLSLPGDTPETPPGSSALNRGCAPGGEAYAPVIEKIYDQFPTTMQRMFCSLKRIFIEQDFAGTAYAGVLESSDGQIDGAAMGIRKTVLDQAISLTVWASWKEQLSFGGATDNYALTEGLPLIRTAPGSQGQGTNDLLYFIMAHEFGHLFDGANDLNQWSDCDDNVTGCPAAPDSWAALSWETHRKPKAENEFPFRNALCFYWCDGQYLDPAHIPAIYENLWNTNFISTYATLQPYDDFADSLAYYALRGGLGASYEIDDVGRRYDSMSKLLSERFRTKLDYIRAFLGRNDIQYP